MFLLALLAQGPTVEAGGLSPDAKWILISLGGALVMVAGFLGRITFALLPSAKEALMGIAKLPASIDGVKVELQKLDASFADLAQEVRDRRASEMAKASEVALAVATGNFPAHPSIPDFSEDPRDDERRPPRAPRSSRGSSPTLPESSERNERRR